VITIRYDRGTLVLEGVRDPLPPGFVWDDRIRRPRGPALLYRDIVLHWHRNRIPFQDEARDYGVLDQMVHRSDRSPRDYQRAALEAWRGAGRFGTVVLPTGTGKSFVAELCIADARRATLVVAPTIDLVNQWAGLMEKAFGAAARPDGAGALTIGVLGGGQHRLGEITISTYDSAYLHMDRYGNRFGLVVFDEVHHLPSAAYSQCAEMAIAPFRLGLSATPERPDGAHGDIDRLVGPVIYQRGIKELSGAYLADYEVERVEVNLSMHEHEAYLDARSTYRSFVASRGISMRSPQGWQRFLREAARSKAGRAALRAHREYRRILHSASAKIDVLEDILSRHPLGRVIVFTNDNATVYRISREFLVPCITHQTDGKERKAILGGFAEGRYRVVVTSRVLNEGVDLPAADVGVVLSGTGSVREHVQRLGRILRPGKDAEGNDKRAVLYEVLTRDTTEEFTSERRRAHDAYQ